MKENIQKTAAGLRTGPFAMKPVKETGGAHGHEHGAPDEGPRLLITLGLNFIIPAIQIAGGFYAHSMALISDAVHNFSDFTAILIAYAAYRIGRRGPTARNTFGYRRAEIIAAFLNVGLLTGAVFFILYEAFLRLQNPHAVSGHIVAWVAGAGVLGNGFSAWMLHRDARHSLNVRGAFLHMIGDLLTSVAVVISGLVLIFKPWYWLDPVLSFLIAAFILKNCFSIFRESVAILMNATPKGLDLNQINTFLNQIPGVCGVHYLHAWNLSSKSVAFSCHVVVPDQPVSQAEALAKTIRQALLERFDIDHPVLQFETAQCGEGNIFCEISCGPASKSPQKNSNC